MHFMKKSCLFFWRTCGNWWYLSGNNTEHDFVLCHCANIFLVRWCTI